MKAGGMEFRETLCVSTKHGSVGLQRIAAPFNTIIKIQLLKITESVHVLILVWIILVMLKVCMLHNFYILLTLLFLTMIISLSNNS